MKPSKLFEPEKVTRNPQDIENFLSLLKEIEELWARNPDAAAARLKMNEPEKVKFLDMLHTMRDIIAWATGVNNGAWTSAKWARNELRKLYERESDT